MKAIMLSMQPQWVAKMLNGEKNVEIRKRFPINYVGWVYVYCTKPKIRYRIEHMVFFSDELYKTPKGEIKFGSSVELMAYDDYDKNNFLSGKVVARFWCDNVSRFDFNEIIHDYTYANRQMKLMTEFLKNAQVPYEEIIAYGKGKDLRAIHITKLEIFDIPKELGEFHTAYKYATLEAIKDYERETGDTTSYRVAKSPQSWQWIEVEE